MSVPARRKLLRKATIAGVLSTSFSSPQLRALGVNVESKVAEDGNGKFAWVVDPEGNKVELWEPKAGH